MCCAVTTVGLGSEQLLYASLGKGRRYHKTEQELPAGKRRNKNPYSPVENSPADLWTNGDLQHVQQFSFWI